MNTLNCFTCGKFISYEHLETVDPVAYEPDYEYYAGFPYDEGGVYRYDCKKCTNLKVADSTPLITYA
jgi:DNA-directed RNA polymerase subunit N (RpoN/RPB10)